MKPSDVGAEIQKAINEIRTVIGEVPILASEQVRLGDGVGFRGVWPNLPQRLLDEAEAADDQPVEKKPEEEATITKTRVLADGTYATETVYTSAAAQARLDQVKAAAKPPLRALILGGDFYTSTVLASTLTKLVLRFGDLAGDSKATHALKAEVGHFRRMVDKC
jgi:coatomer subunit beta